MASNISEEMIEKNKDKLDLKPDINFVSEHIEIYEQGLKRLLNLPKIPKSEEFAKNVKFEDLEKIVQPQISPNKARDIISVMPESFISLSDLESVKYFDRVPVPIYNDDGDFLGGAEWVKLNEFPRNKDHESRILIGLSDGNTIYTTPVPMTVSTDEKAIEIYQTHVFLHEFFHTIELPKRDSDIRRGIILEYKEDRFTLEDFWNRFGDLYLKEEKKFVSKYASTYDDKLNQKVRDGNLKEFDYALAEQICESFVGYMLGIISNNNNSVDFKKTHPKEYDLIDKLYNSKRVDIQQ